MLLMGRLRQVPVAVETICIFVDRRRIYLLHPVTAYVLTVIFVATFTRSTIGFGEALVAVPLLALRLPLSVAAPLAVLVSVAMATVIVSQDWRHLHVRSAGGLILAALPGIPLGILLLSEGNEHALKILVGVLIIGFSLYFLAGRATPHIKEDQRGWLIGCGFLSGVLGGACGMNGPPLAIYGALRRWSPQHFRATLQGYFLVASLASLFGYAILGIWTATITRYFLVSLPAVVIATLLGRTVNRRMKHNGFFQVVYVGLIAIGSLLVLQAIRG